MSLKLAVVLPVGEANLIASSLAENDHPVWSDVGHSATDRVIRDYAVYECLQDHLAGEGLDPLLDSTNTYWLRVGATNRWKPFDKFIADPAVGLTGDDITYTLGNFGAPSGVVACLGLAGVEVTLEVTDPVDGVVYSRTESLIDTSMIIDAYTYCFEPARVRTEVVFRDVPPYAGAEYHLTIRSDAGEPKVGQIVVGREYYLGEAQFGMEFGITDYSDTERNRWGGLSIVERPFSKKVDYRARVDAEWGRRVAIVLEENRAKPVLVFAWEDSDRLGVTAYGKLGDWRITTQDNIESFLRMKIEGLA